MIQISEMDFSPEHEVGECNHGHDKICVIQIISIVERRRNLIHAIYLSHRQSI